MPFDYNNANSPYYSEADRTWTAPQNWTVNGVDALSLWFRGDSGNSPAQLYVSVQDSAGKSFTVSHPDLNAVVTTTWTEWRIPLSQFTSVNPAKVKKMVIGVGNSKSPAADGHGLLYFDDIRVIKP